MVEIKEAWGKWDEWVRKNWMTVLGIILILIIVMWNLSVCDSRKIEISEECNMYWRTKMARTCPELTSDPGWVNMDIGELDGEE